MGEVLKEENDGVKKTGLPPNVQIIKQVTKTPLSEAAQGLNRKSQQAQPAECYLSFPAYGPRSVPEGRTRRIKPSSMIIKHTTACGVVGLNGL